MPTRPGSKPTEAVAPPEPEVLPAAPQPAADPAIEDLDAAIAQKVQPLLATIEGDLGDLISDAERPTLEARLSEIPEPSLQKEDGLRRQIAEVEQRLSQCAAAVAKFEPEAAQLSGEQATVLAGLKQQKDRFASPHAIEQVSARLKELTKEEDVYKRVAKMLKERNGSIPGWLRRTTKEDALLAELKAMTPAGQKFQWEEAVRLAEKKLSADSSFAKEIQAVRAEYEPLLAQRRSMRLQIDDLHDQAAKLKLSHLLERRRPFEDRQRELTAEKRRLEQELADLPQLGTLPGDLALRISRSLVAALETELDPGAKKVLAEKLVRLQAARNGAYWRSFERTHPREFRDATRRIKILNEPAAA